MPTRRNFLATAAGTLAAAGALSADPLGLPIGCQTYPVREMLGKDFEGTLKQLSGIGYRTIEMCSPPGYERSGYGALVSMKPAEMKAKIQAAGLACESCHYQFRELKESLPERIAFAKELGLKQMIISTFSLPKDATLAHWTKACDEANKIGAETRKAGIQTGFHNHHGEFQQLEGALIYDKMLATLDPNLVKMQFQVSVVSLGFNAADYFKKHPGRFVSIHLQDWSATEKKSVAVGKGSVDWKALFAAARKGGVKNYFVELDLDQMKESYPYLHSLKV